MIEETFLDPREWPEWIPHVEESAPDLGLDKPSSILARNIALYFIVGIPISVAAILVYKYLFIIPIIAKLVGLLVGAVIALTIIGAVSLTIMANIHDYVTNR